MKIGKMNQKPSRRWNPSALSKWPPSDSGDTLFLADSGKLFACGSSFNNESPEVVEAPSDLRFAEVSTREGRSVLLTEFGEAWWFLNDKSPFFIRV